MGMMSKSSYVEMIKENIEWLEKQPKSLERDHLIVIANDPIDRIYTPDVVRNSHIQEAERRLEELKRKKSQQGKVPVCTLSVGDSVVATDGFCKILGDDHNVPFSIFQSELSVTHIDHWNYSALCESKEGDECWVPWKYLAHELKVQPAKLQCGDFLWGYNGAWSEIVGYRQVESSWVFRLKDGKIKKYPSSQTVRCFRYKGEE